MEKKTAVIILNYNNWEDTVNCINSIEQFNTSPISIIVVDNGSPNQSVSESLDNFFKTKYLSDYIFVKDKGATPKELPYLTFLSSSSNDGYAKGNNKGLEIAKNAADIENVLIINNDVLFVDDIIPKLKKAMATLPNAGLVSPILYTRNHEKIDYHCARKRKKIWFIISTLFFVFYYPKKVMTYEYRHSLIHKLDFAKDEFLKIDLPSGSCMFTTLDFFKEIGGFDTHTFLYYEEDILFEKINALKKQNYLLTNCEAIHLGAQSTSKVVKSFPLKCTLESIDYYLKEFRTLSISQKIAYGISKQIVKFKLLIIDIVK